MKTVVLSSGNAAKLNVLDFQMSSINAFGDLSIRRALGTGKRVWRSTLNDDKANVVYAAVYNAAHVRYIGFIKVILAS